MDNKTATLDTVKMTVDLKGVQTVTGEPVSDYNQLNNKPQINNVELTGNKTLDELNIQPKGEYVTDDNYVHTDNNYTNEDKSKLAGLSNYTLPVATETELGGVKIGNNINKSEDGTISVEITQGDNGATFTPSVSEEGIISWTNDQSLSNPDPVNIKGPKGDKGDPGSGTTELVGTQDEPIVLSTIRNPGVYKISGYIKNTNTATANNYDSGSAIIFYVEKDRSGNVTQRYYNSNEALSMNARVGFSSSLDTMLNSNFSTYRSADSLSYPSTQQFVSSYMLSRYIGSGGNEILTSALTTTAKSSLVAAINELVERVEALEGNIGE